MTLAPPPVAALFDLERTRDDDPRCPLPPSGVEAATIRAYLRERAAALYPDALIVEDCALPFARIDLLIASPQATIGILICGSGDGLARPRRARGIEAFDYAVAIAAHPRLEHIAALPGDVYRLIVREREDGLRFVPALPWPPPSPRSQRSASSLLRVLFGREIEAIARALPRRGAKETQEQHLDRCLSAEDARRHVRAALKRRASDPGPLNGGEIADALVAELSAATTPPAAVVRELTIAAYNGGIADVALTTPGSLDLYEIKGDTDSPARLRRQVADYDAVGTSCTLVTTWRRLSAFAARVPPHWGLLVAERAPEGGCRFRRVTPSRPNPHRRATMLAGLLHTADLYGILRRVRRGQPWRYSSVHRLRELVVESVDAARLTTLVARAVALRKPFEVRQRQAVSLGAPQEWPGIDAILGSDPAAFDASHGGEDRLEQRPHAIGGAAHRGEHLLVRGRGAFAPDVGDHADPRHL